MTFEEAVEFACDNCSRNERIRPLEFWRFVHFTVGDCRSENIATDGFMLAVGALIPTTLVSEALKLHARPKTPEPKGCDDCGLYADGIHYDDVFSRLMRIEEFYEHACLFAADVFKQAGFAVDTQDLFD